MLLIPFLHHHPQTTLSAQADHNHRRRPWHGLHILALCLAATLSLSLLQPALAALVWQIRTVDSAGDVGLGTSLALDSSGRPVISYFDFSNFNLKLVRCGDATCSSGNTIVAVDSAGNVGLHASLVLDSSGNPVISYYDGSNGDLKLVRCGDATCSSGNTFQIVDSTGDVGQFTSLQLDGSGRPVISYFDVTNLDLKLVRCGNTTCSSGNTIQTLDSAGVVGRDPSLVLDGSGRPVISYYDISNDDLKLVRCITICSIIQTVDSAGDVGQHSSLVLDSSGRPVISYTDDINGDLKLVHCGNTTCSSGNTIVIVENATNSGRYTSLVLDSSGKPIISYYDAFNGDLKLVQCGDATCSSGNTFQIVDSAGTVGGFTSLVLDSSGKPVISYYDYTNSNLKVARLIDNSPPPSVTVNQAAGQADPANSNPVLFSASFSEAVTGFTDADVTLSGTANLVGASITVSGGPSDYTISVSGLAGSGTVIATIAAAVAADGDGNLNTASTSTDNSVTVNFDSTPPVITPSVVGTLGSNGWYVSDVTLSWSVVDNESAISSQTGCDPLTVNSDTPGVIFTCTASSAGGSTSQSVTIQRDATAPTISFASRTPPNSNGWNNSDVTLTWDCSDATAGVVSASVSQSVGSEGANQAASATCTDPAGNTAHDTQTGISIDKTPPTLSPTVTPNPVAVGGAATVTAGATDALSGVESASCGALDTATAGVKSVTCTATDKASNSNSVSVNYTVNAAPPPTLYQQVQTVRSSLAALLPSGDSKTDKALQKALGKIDQALAANLWQADGNHLTLIGDDVFNRLYDAVQALSKIKNPAPAIGAASSSLVTISRALAQIALDEAMTGGGDAGKIAKAQSKLSKGDSEVAKGKLAKAIAQYEDAWEYAQQALGRPVASSLAYDEASEVAVADESDSSATESEGNTIEKETGGLNNQVFLPVVSR